MSVTTPVYQINSENKPVGNLLKKAGQFGMALSILGSAQPPVAVVYVSDSSIPKPFSINSELSSTNLNKTIEAENELNQYSLYIGPKSSSNEYIESNYFTLKGSLLEAKYKMENDSEDYEVLYNEDVLFDFSFESTAKKVFELPGELRIIKNAKLNYEYNADDFLQDEVNFAPTPKRTFTL